MSYDLQSVKLPRLHGTGLRLLAFLMETALGRRLLFKSLLKNAGVIEFRKKPYSDVPTFLPLHPAEAPAQKSAAASSPLPRSRNVCTGFAFPSVLDYHHLYRSGKASPEEVAEKVIQAIDDSNRHDPPLRALTAWKEEEILSQARASSARYRAGRPLGFFDGVPVAVKEEFDMAPFPTTVGTRFLGSTPAETDATVVARMRAAGAVMIGKCNMHEIGIGVTGLNPHHGTPRNPYDLSRHTGGSSSGPAAAVAAGLCPVAIGADGGGSIRIPSAFCGLVGLKPTYGRVSEAGAAELCWSVAHNGVLAANAFDAFLAYAQIAGVDPKDPHTLQQPAMRLPDLRKPVIKGLRIGIYGPWFRHADDETVSICENLLKQYVRLGARLAEIVLPELEDIRVAHTVTIGAEMTAAMARHYRAHRTDFGLDVRINLALARSFTARDYLLAQRIRTRAIGHFKAALQQVDVIITPAAGCVPPPISEKALESGESDLSTLVEIMRFAVPANLTGLPAIAFPAGYTAGHLPVSLQAIGRPWHEDLLLAIAHASESLIERQAPALFYPVLSSAEFKDKKSAVRRTAKPQKQKNKRKQ